MSLRDLQVWKWTFFACGLLSSGTDCPVFLLIYACVLSRIYMVAIPAVIQGGSEAKLCASLLQPDEVLVMTISLIADGQKETLLTKSSEQEFYSCFPFQVPNVKNKKVYIFQVEVRGKTFLSIEKRKVMIIPYTMINFIQTDKPIYIPGQTVHFRVITLGTNFNPVKQLVSDPHQNRIGQWMNITSRGSILQLSYSLNSEAREGSYLISAWVGENARSHMFTVEKYGRLSFFLLPIMPGNVHCTTILEYSLNGCYSFLSIEFQYVFEVCCFACLQLDQTGCGSHNFNLSFFTKKTELELSDVFTLNVKVEEEGTGVIRSEEKQASITYEIGKIRFVDTPKIYEHGSIIEGKVKVVDFKNNPIAHMMVHLFKGHIWYPTYLQNLTTDTDGIASFSINTTLMPKENIKLNVYDKPQFSYREYRIPYFSNGNHEISGIQPTSIHRKTSSSLSVQKIEEPMPCGEEVSITVQYAIVGETVPKGSVDVIYLALSRGVLVQQGHVKVPVPQENSATEGDVTLKLTVVPEMAPMVQILVYSILPSETVIAHSTKFPIEKCFRNKVSVEFSPSKAVPGEKNTLQLSAQPGSLCGLSAVDQSVHIMKPGMKLNADQVTELTELYCHTMFCCDWNTTRTRECVCVYVCVCIYENCLLFLILTKPHNAYLVLFHQMNTFMFLGGLMSYGHPAGVSMGMLNFPGEPGMAYGEPYLPAIQTVRTFFPETWIWDLVEVGESGSADVSLTVPDTITTWETEAFCLGPGGFGLAPPVKLTVFQPFFLEVILPYSIIRGENFELKATVFNYLSKCIMVSVTPAESSDYTLTPLNDVQYSSCLCANERKTFRWTLSPSVLGVLNVSVRAEAVQSDVSCDNEIVTVPERGRIDTVTRSGGKRNPSTIVLLLFSKDDSLKEVLCLYVGDVLGRALKNLDGLLQMPYGCGEQNMALLAPNIYILEYLNNTAQLTPAIRDKATKFLTSGYQRQLNYKHSDGAYSTFGQGSGNTWLTAFVLRSFGKAKSFIYIDPKNIAQSKSWLESQQGMHGCFNRKGKLFNNRMKGGVTDEVTLTAYITASMLELNTPVTDPVVTSSLSCLRNSTSDLSNTYTTALLAYTFTLAGDMEMRTLLLQHLDKIALKEEGLLHWTQTSSETSASLAVEISSYVLLASLNVAPLSSADLGYASLIVRWLVKQQNSHGGFSSTQDTVVALQALALYSTKVFSNKGAITVTIQAPGGHTYLFELNQNNKLLYQERELEDTKGKYSVKVKGNACASVQVSEYTTLLRVLVVTVKFKRLRRLFYHNPGYLMFIFGLDVLPAFLFTGGAQLQHPHSY
uniref:Alpha-2-macroglobulin domain-containing protein n=1 Tax=Esox lucius TaxID=8010 RepID=A0A6Q2WUM8_ESOLU